MNLQGGPPADVQQSSTQQYLRPLTDFLHEKASAGILLVVGAAVAKVWANSPCSDSYVELWNTLGTANCVPGHVDESDHSA